MINIYLYDDSETITKKEPVKQLVPVQDTRDVKDRKVPSELKCPMCSNLLHDAVLIPCCGTSYCDECKYNGRLLHVLL